RRGALCGHGGPARPRGVRHDTSKGAFGVSRFLDSKFSNLEPYVPGEQPKDREYIKLNANESPYPPTPAVLEALRSEAATALNLYPDAACRELAGLLAEQFGLGEG